MLDDCSHLWVWCKIHCGQWRHSYWLKRALDLPGTFQSMKWVMNCLLSVAFHHQSQLHLVLSSPPLAPDHIGRKTGTRSVWARTDTHWIPQILHLWGTLFFYLSQFVFLPKKHWDLALCYLLNLDCELLMERIFSSYTSVKFPWHLWNYIKSNNSNLSFLLSASQIRIVRCFNTASSSAGRFGVTWCKVNCYLTFH